MPRKLEDEMRGPAGAGTRTYERERANSAGNGEAQREGREGRASRGAADPRHEGEPVISDEAYRRAVRQGQRAFASLLSTGLAAEEGDREALIAGAARRFCTDDGTDAFKLGGLLAERGDLAGATVALRHADESGHAAGASNLGTLLETQGDLEGAEAAYRRADARGDMAGAFNLGALLAERGDLTSAVVAFRRADERGDPVAAFDLGVLLEQEGDLAEALAAYRRADERGYPNAALSLGRLLERDGDPAGAEAAYRRAAAGRDTDVARMGRQALLSLAASTPRRVTEQAVGRDPAPNEPKLGGTVSTVTTGVPPDVGDHHAGRERDHTEGAEATPTVTSYVPLPVDRCSDTDDSGQPRRNPASLLPFPRLQWASVLPELLLGAGFTMLAVAIAGLVG
jgi:tetratricopeptide (TPR) repeat protein